MVSPLYKSYKGLEARVESRSANHRPSRLGHVGTHNGLWLDGDWASDTFFSVTERQKRDYLSRASQRARGATKNGVTNWYTFGGNFWAQGNINTHMANTINNLCTVALSSFGRVAPSTLNLSSP